MEEINRPVRARDNAFAVERVEQIRYKPQGSTFDELLIRLEQMNFCAAIIGPEGSGKTTLLEDIGTALDKQGRRIKHVFVNDSNPMTWQSSRELFMQIRAGQIVLLDGADSIGRATWQALKRGILRKAGGLVVTAHKAGLMPTLVECTTTLDLFKQIVSEITSGRCEMRPEMLDEAYHRNNGNIREALRELYDIFSNAGEIAVTDVGHRSSTADSRQIPRAAPQIPE
jgi:energy-coupling factor transporter ATP-binding protein EcfA2